MKHALSVAVGLVIVFGVMLFRVPETSENPLGLAVCTVTESKVVVGHQQSLTILAAGARSWAIIQQPLNATNTISLSLGGTAVAGSGYTLTPATSTSPVSELRLGFSTDLPTGVAVTARTSTGSSTLNVITCR
jgi:hypothetical protein